MAKQLDLFEDFNNGNKVPASRLLEMLEAVDGIRHPKFRVSDALGGCADMLAGKPEGKSRGFNRFVHRVGRAIRPVLLRIDRKGRVETVREAAQAQVCFEGIGTMCGSPSSLDDLKDLMGAS